MRKMGVALASVTAALVLAAPMAAQAGVTCKWVKGWCAADKAVVHEEATRTSVPEPGTLMLLAAGITAVGGAALRRKSKK